MFRNNSRTKELEKQVAEMDARFKRLLEKKLPQPETKMENKKLTIGCRCRILKNKSKSCFNTGWNSHVGEECILVERNSSGGFSFILLGKPPAMVMDGSKYYGRCAWIYEEQLELIDMDFNKNIPFIDWVQENDNNFCPDCLTFLGKKDVCENCGFER